MKNTVLVIVSIIVIGMLTLAIVNRNLIAMVYTIYQMTPKQSFDESTHPTEPDYADPIWWAGLPDRIDEVDATPADEFDNQTAAEVDVFFIHPTTYFEPGNGWNQPLDNVTANQRLKLGVMKGQASSFNGCCKIYAPKYRQAALSAFMDEDDGPKALNLAYTDVKAAFEYFLENQNNGRPFILASHSQGSHHGVRLLEDYFTGKPLLDRLVAAYLVGGPMTDSHLQKTPDIPLCDSPTMTRCQMTWNTVSAEAANFNEEPNHCVNPLNWKANGGQATHKENLGGVRFMAENDNPDKDPNIVDATCLGGRLVISKPAEGYDRMFMRKGNYHIYDYSLFYMNIRENAIERTIAFLNQRASEPG